MHELQMAGDLMGAVLSSLEGRTDVLRVEEVHVTLGKLSMIGEEQLRFCWEAITEEETLLKGSALVVSYEDGALHCRSCGYDGPLDLGGAPLLHTILPVFACPMCGGGIDITKGRSVQVDNIRAVSSGEEAR